MNFETPHRDLVGMLCCYVVPSRNTRSTSVCRYKSLTYDEARVYTKIIRSTHKVKSQNLENRSTTWTGTFQVKIIPDAKFSFDPNCSRRTVDPTHRARHSSLIPNLDSTLLYFILYYFLNFLNCVHNLPTFKN